MGRQELIGVECTMVKEIEKPKEENELAERFSLVNPYFKKVYKDALDRHEEGVSELSTELKRFSIKQYNRLRTNRDIYDAHTGAEGEGKSNNSIILGYLIDPNFDIKRNIIYSPTVQEMKEKISWRKLIARGVKPDPEKNLPPYSVIVVDEAIKVVYKLEQWSGVSRFLKKLFALARLENKMVILNIPDFLDMGGTFRNRMNYWTDCFTRGLGTVMIRSKNIFKTDKFDLQKNEQSYDNQVTYNKKNYAGITPEEHVSYLSRSLNFVGTVTFPKLPKVINDEYERLKAESDYEGKGEDEGEENNDRYHKAINQRNQLFTYVLTRGITIKDISDALNIPYPNLSNWKRQIKESDVIVPSKL